MMNPESRQRLQDFIDRAKYLESLSYLDGGEKIVTFTAKKVDDKFEVEFSQPDDEVRDALLFNVRLFLQDKDEISLRRMTDLYSDQGVSETWKNEIGLYRNELNIRLARIAASGPKGELSHRDVLNMFLYGAFGHHDSKDKSRKLYQKWVTDETEYEILHNTFHTVLIWVIATVMNISRASQDELERHK